MVAKCSKEHSVCSILVSETISLTLSLKFVKNANSLSYFQEQYIFVYDALLEALKAGNTAIGCSEFRQEFKRLMTVDPVKGKTPLQEQYEVSMRAWILSLYDPLTYSVLDVAFMELRFCDLWFSSNKLVTFSPFLLTFDLLVFRTCS